MFAKDFNLLNDIYDRRILRESTESGVEQTTVGDKGGYGESEESNIEQVKKPVKPVVPHLCSKCAAAMNIPPEEADIVLAKEPVHSGYDNVESCEESNARMAKQELYRIAKMSYMLHDLICDQEQLEPWLADKISRAYEGMNSVFAYKDYEQFRGDEEEGMQVEEGTERDLFKSLDRGGINIINQIKRTVRNESKETVEKILVECISALEAKK